MPKAKVFKLYAIKRNANGSQAGVQRVDNNPLFNKILELAKKDVENEEGDIRKRKLIWIEDSLMTEAIMRYSSQGTIIILKEQNEYGGRQVPFFYVRKESSKEEDLKAIEKERQDRIERQLRIQKEEEERKKKKEDESSKN